MNLESDAKPTNTNNDTFQLELLRELMQFRVRKILLVAGFSDNFLLKKLELLLEKLPDEYDSLNLGFSPQIERVMSGEEALNAIKGDQYDLVIIISRTYENSFLEFGRKAKEMKPGLPVVHLTYEPTDIDYLIKLRTTRGIDKVFQWTDDSRLLLTIIKYVEDVKNVDNDIRLGVRVILYIEDSPWFYSRILPILYSEILVKSRLLLNESSDKVNQLLRMRACPKVLTSDTYESTLKLYKKYKSNLLGVISDVRFPRKGALDDAAGLRFARKIKREIPDLPFLLQSSNLEHRKIAYDNSLDFLHKESENIVTDMQRYISSNFGFGDFVFRNNTGIELGRARNLNEFEEMMRTVPPESIIFHAGRNHFSIWLRARTEFEIAEKIRPMKISDFDNVERMRQFIVGEIEKISHRNQEVRQPIVEYRKKIKLIFQWGEFLSVEHARARTHYRESDTEAMQQYKIEPNLLPQAKGEKLEKSIFELFQKLFKIDESHLIQVKKKTLPGDPNRKSRYLEQKRWQDSGIQYGYDLEFKWKDVLLSDKDSGHRSPGVKCYIECKHFSNNINHMELFGKLSQMKANQNAIDHWILISPHANLTNTAQNLLEQLENEYPFDIHIWTQEYGVEELFGIVPEVFEEFFILPDSLREDKLINPRLWTTQYRQAIIDKWLDKLPPKYRLPNGKLLPTAWVEHLKNAPKTLISFAGEDEEIFAVKRNEAITNKERVCFLEDGSVGNLHSEFIQWLESDGNQILAILGEFGSGKTMHSYWLGIDAAEMFLQSPENSRIPIRLTLKNCMDSNLQEVFKEQLHEMNTSYEEFVGLNAKEKFLFILDGFDEMSRYITHRMTHDRFKMLYHFCDRYKRSKILLTCRTQYFKSAEEEEEILGELDRGKKIKIKKLYLGKFTTENITSWIEKKYSNTPGDSLKKPQELMRKMKSKYDLMGMSSNPLILSMIAQILDEIPSEKKNVSQTLIYKTYLEKWLNREISKCEVFFTSDRERMKSGVISVMHELAYEIYRKEHFLLSYDDLKRCLSSDKLDSLKIFDKITLFTGEQEEEISEGIKTRSLLVREDNKFRFVHRSIMEFFIAEKLYQDICQHNEPKHLGEVQLSFEIINFIADLAMDSEPLFFLKRLQAIEYPTRETQTIKGKYLGTNILSIFYSVKKVVNERSNNHVELKEDWKKIVAIGSILISANMSNAIFCNSDLSESHLENANLENTDFTGANFKDVVFGETEEIVYAKWGPLPEEMPTSFHSDNKILEWNPLKKVPVTVKEIKVLNIVPPYDFTYPDGNREILIAGWFHSSTASDDLGNKRPLLLSINNSGQFVSFYRENRIMVFNVNEFRCLYRIYQPDVSSLHLSVGGKYLTFVVDKKTVYFHDVSNSISMEISTNDFYTQVTGIAVSPNGESIYTGFENGEISCFRKATGNSGFERSWNKKIHEKTVKNISFCETTHQLLSCGADKRICIIDGKNGALKYQMQMLLKCKGMRIKNVTGLSDTRIEELLARGAIIS